MGAGRCACGEVPDAHGWRRDAPASLGHDGDRGEPLRLWVRLPAPHQLMTNSAAFWFLMQIGMIIGFATFWPANVWLIKRGIKVPM